MASASSVSTHGSNKHERSLVTRLGTALTAVSGVAPSVAARLALRVFLTPRRVTARDTSPGTTTGRAGPGLPFELLVNDVRLPGRVWGEGPPVFLVHGWEGFSQQLDAFVEPLVERGFRPLSFDMPAHGKARGSTTNVIEFMFALLAAERHFGVPHAIVAHSLGATASYFALCHGLKAEAAVLMSPMPSLEFALSQFQTLLGLSPSLTLRMAGLIESRIEKPLSDFDLAMPRPDLKTPLLLIHDEDDKVIPFEHSEAIERASPHARRLATRGLGHRRLLTDERVIAESVAFVAGHNSERRLDLDRIFDTGGGADAPWALL